jgi:hypothetical protein
MSGAHPTKTHTHSTPPSPSIPPHPTKQSAPRTFYPAARRLVALGDLHGDYDKAIAALRTAGLVSVDARTGQHRWAGGDTTLVQVGDILDRGDGELRLLYFLERLAGEAAAAGGAVHVLTGNHETLNVGGRFRYATPGGVAEFYRWDLVRAVGAGLKARCGCDPGGPIKPHFASSSSSTASSSVAASGGPDGVEAAGVAARSAALSPGGPIAMRFLAPHPVALQVGSTLFVHGGLLPRHVPAGPASLDAMNAATASWMRGEAAPGGGGGGGQPRPMPPFLGGRHAVVWARDFSAEDPARCDCAGLADALAALPGVARQVMGHTIQEGGVSAACGGRALRVDVGLSAGCGDGTPAVLEILGDGATVRALGEGGRVLPVAGLGSRTEVEGGGPRERAPPPPQPVAAVA